MCSNITCFLLVNILYRETFSTTFVLIFFFHPTFLSLLFAWDFSLSLLKSSFLFFRFPLQPVFRFHDVHLRESFLFRETLEGFVLTPTATSQSPSSSLLSLPHTTLLTKGVLSNRPKNGWDSNNEHAFHSLNAQHLAKGQSGWIGTEWQFTFYRLICRHKHYCYQATAVFLFV